MPYDGIGQALCGPFSEKDFPDFAAAVTHASAHWYPIMNNSMQQIITLHQKLSYHRKDKRRWLRLSWERAHKGLPPNPDTGGPGVYPFMGSRATFFKAIADLKAIGILIENQEGQLAIDYSVRMSDLIEYDQVQRYAKKAMPRSWGATYEGLLQCASLLDQHDLHMYEQIEQCSKNRSQSTETTTEAPSPQGDGKSSCRNTPTSTTSSAPLTAMGSNSPFPSHLLRMGWSYVQRPIAYLACSMQRLGACKIRVFSGSYYNRTDNQYSSSDKSSEVIWGKTRDMIMRSVEDLKRSITAAVDTKREKLRDKRKKRRTLADRVKLFEAAWNKGQSDRNQFPGGIKLSRDIKNLKAKILVPMERTDIDPEAFAYWVTHNWTAIGNRYFAKSKKYPRSPAFGWMLACLDTYLDAYADKDVLDPSLNETIAERSKRIVRTAEATEKRAAALAKRAELSRAKHAELQSTVWEQEREIRELKQKLGEDHAVDFDGNKVKRRKTKQIGRFE